MSKANKDGWIRHRGGKCPVKNGTPIDLRFRGIPEEKASIYAEGWEWNHYGISGDIMAYRLHTQQETKREEPVTTPTAESIFKEYQANLDAIAAANADIAIRTTKNLELRKQLNALGFDFYDAPKEDMNDPENWRVGDILESVDNDIAPVGSLATIVKIIDGAIHKRLSCGRITTCDIQSQPKFYKFHSRPSN